MLLLRCNISIDSAEPIQYTDSNKASEQERNFLCGILQQ